MTRLRPFVPGLTTGARPVRGRVVAEPQHVLVERDLEKAAAFAFARRGEIERSCHDREDGFFCLPAWNRFRKSVHKPFFEGGNRVSFYPNASICVKICAFPDLYAPQPSNWTLLWRVLTLHGGSLDPQNRHL